MKNTCCWCNARLDDADEIETNPRGQTATLYALREGTCCDLSREALADDGRGFTDDEIEMLAAEFGETEVNQ